jgi:hypothetical protein
MTSLPGSKKNQTKPSDPLLLSVLEFLVYIIKERNGIFGSTAHKENVVTTPFVQKCLSKIQISV